MTFENLTLEERLEHVVANYDGLAFSTSLGQEDQVILHAIAKRKLPIRVFTLDTGRLFQETYELIDKSRAKYKIPIEVFYPDTTSVQNLTGSKGFHSFYNSMEERKECCGIRKIEPLERALKDVKVWITGLRAEQSDNRATMEFWEKDHQRDLYKFNPLLDWKLEDVTEYLKIHNIPDNPLHKKGFVSIGCAPCTRAIEPGEHPRAGRWWWESSKKECGLHQS